MPKATFTARWVAGIQAPERGQLDYFDNKSPNLGLRVSYGGKKSWFVMYRYQGRLRRLTLGIYPHLRLADARSKGTTIRHAVAQGEDPATEKQTLHKAPTVAEVVEQFMTLYSKPHKKSWREDHATFQKEILPVWGSRKFADIMRRDVIMLLDKLIERGVPAQANRLKGLVSKLYN
ncbi:MAG: Arm DNA-binding domain-containing protein [bacterium]|nr:Arm DNA-binding domain-containing protein [bacterium]